MVTTAKCVSVWLVCALGHILFKLRLKGKNMAGYEVALNCSFCPQGCQLHSAACYM